MLASSSAGAYICLRCQSRTARARLVRAADASHHRILPIQRRPFTQTSIQQETEDGSVAKKPRIRSNRRVYVHGRIRGKKGGEVREVTEVLPQGALGKPAEVIILKDAGIKKSETHKPDEAQDTISAGAVSSQSAIFKSIKGDAKLADEGSVASSIEQIRDRVLQEAHDRRDGVTAEELVGLAASIIRSFSTTQLKAYAQHILQGQKSRKTIQSQWTPGISKRIPDQHHKFVNIGHRSIVQSTKPQLAQMIIRTGWDLTASNDAGIGEIDFLDVQGISLVKDESGKSILNQIALSRQVVIEPLEDRIFRITGSKVLATAALQDITKHNVQEVVEQLKVVRMDIPAGTKATRTSAANDHETTDSLISTKQTEKKSEIPSTSGFISHAAKYPITAKDLQSLKSLTGVSGRFTSEQPVRLRLKGYSTEQIDDARRMLYSISDLHTRSETQYSSIGLLAGQGMETSHSMTSNLSYIERRQMWSRRCNLVAMDVEAQIETPQLKAPKSATNPYADLYEKLTKAEGTTMQRSIENKINSLWAGLQQSYSARLGFVQHAEGEGGKRDTTFTPGMAYLPTVLSYLAAPGPSQPTSVSNGTISFIFRHDPVPDHNVKERSTKKGKKVKSQPFDAFPELRFNFEVSQSATGSQIPTLTDITAICAHHNIGIAMPDSPIDFGISLITTRSLSLEHAATTTFIEHIIEKMRESILGPGRLRAPPTIKIPIPQDWIRQNQALEKWPTDALSDHISALYCFVGVEHKQSIPFDFHGQPASYEVVDGGKLAGSYSQLKVDASPPGEGVDAAIWQKRARKQAVTNGVKLVDIVKKAALGLLKYDKTRDVTIDAGTLSPTGTVHEAVVFDQFSANFREGPLAELSEEMVAGEDSGVEKRAAAGS